MHGAKFAGIVSVTVRSEARVNHTGDVRCMRNGAFCTCHGGHMACRLAWTTHPSQAKASSTTLASEENGGGDDGV